MQTNNEASLNPFKGLFNGWFRISSVAAAIISWMLIQPDEPGDDSVEAKPAEPLMSLSVVVGRIFYALLVAVFGFWTVLTVTETVYVIFGFDFSYNWLNFPWWIVLPMWLPAPFIYYFFSLGYELLASVTKKK